MKTILITGASSGIGAETAKLFAKDGCNVALTYKQNEQGAKEIAAEIEKLGGVPLVMQADLTKGIDARRVVDETLGEFSTLDVLVNNAGGYIDGDEWNGDEEIWNQTHSQNLTSVMSVSKYAIKQFQKQKSGVIVNIASRHGLMGQYDALAYAAAKAGVINVTQAYAKLLAPYGRANSVSPGAVNTGYWLTAPKDELEEEYAKAPLGRLVETKDVAATVVHLASDEAEMITGQNIAVDGGYLLK